MADKTSDADKGQGGDALKRHGDKMGDVMGIPSKPAPDRAISGDSPKPHGDKLGHAVDEAVKKPSR